MYQNDQIFLAQVEEKPPVFHHDFFINQHNAN
jgi:hypothetical protein